jgi:hypothetical protein
LARLLPHLARDDLLIMERGFPAVWLFTLLRQRGIPFLARMDGTQWPGVEPFLHSGQTGMPVTPQVSDSARRHAQAAGMHLIDNTVTFHLIRVRLPTGSVAVLATALLDPQAFPAEAFKELYPARWGIEEAFNLDTSVDRFSTGMKTTRRLVCAVLRAPTFWVRALRTRWHGQKAAGRRGSSCQGMALPRRRALPAGFLAAHSGASNRGIWVQRAQAPPLPLKQFSGGSKALLRRLIPREHRA